MDAWPPKLKLVSVLATTHLLLSRSQDDGWPDENPKEAAKKVEAAIAHIFDPTTHSLPEYWSIQFAATGSIQEVAIANGWSDAYMKLAEEYDGLSYLIESDKKSK